MSKFLPEAATLADEHRARRRSPRDTIRATLERVNRLQRALNAFATIDEADATARAAAIADDIEHGRDPGPLAGVPVSVKDILDETAIAPGRKGLALPA